jgi:hypothetical protein
MTDEPEVPEEEEPEATWEYMRDSEYVEVEGAQIIAPKGWGVFADESGAALVRVRMAKGGDIDILVQSEDEIWRWQQVDKPSRSGTLKSIKPA